MVIAAHYVALNTQNCVLCIKDMPDNCEDMTAHAVRDYNRARAYLKDLSTREKAIICDDIDQAVRTAVDIARQLR